MAATDKQNSVFEQVFDNIRKAAESNMKMQQEMFRQWSIMWPGMPSPQAMWLDQVRDFQKRWSSTISDLARKHRDVVDRQLQAAVESLDEALRATEASNPEEFRKRAEQLCRKTVDCVREISEAQMKEFQEAANKWTELITKTGT